MSEGEDSTMSDEEAEEETDYEEDVEDSSSENDESDENEVDTGDDEGPSNRAQPDTSGSGKSRPAKENAKKSNGLKRKAEIITKDRKIKKSKNDEPKTRLVTAAKAAMKTFSGDKKGKKLVKKPIVEEVAGTDEVQADPIAADSTSKSGNSSVTGEKKTKDYPIFEEKNIDYNFVKNSTLNVVQRRCQIAQNIILHCKNIEISHNGQKYDYASLTFSRKTKNGKAFDYNMPLALAPVLIEAVQQIINDNSKFFANLREKELKNS